MKEKLNKVIFNVVPQVRIRVIETNDKKAKEKKKYPFKLDNDVIVTIDTDERRFSFKIKKGYIWNGADIPRLLWRCIGSRTDNAYLIASMVHDFMLEFKKHIIEDVLKNSMELKEYRRLTSLVFRQILKDTGTNTIKANIMSWCVDVFQMTFNNKGWRI